MKTACGNCGSKTGCGCSTQNPYEGEDVVWHDPTRYDVVKHGPSYLRGPAKLASAQKAAVRAFVKQAAESGSMLGTDVAPPLSLLVAFMRGLAHVHQSHHWQTSGGGFYADHLLFDRLYSESLEFIDQVAERAVGVEGRDAVDPFLQASGVLMVVSHICGHAEGDSRPSSLETSTPDLLVDRSLRGEVLFLKAVPVIISKLQANGNLTPGTSNLLEGVADKHESFVYLLQQRNTQPASYSYDRG